MTRPKYIRKPFDRLPLKQRAIYILWLAGFTQKEIGKMLVISQPAVTQAISRICNKYSEEMLYFLHI